MAGGALSGVASSPGAQERPYPVHNRHVQLGEQWAQLQAEFALGYNGGAALHSSLETQTGPRAMSPHIVN